MDLPAKSVVIECSLGYFSKPNLQPVLKDRSSQRDAVQPDAIHVVGGLTT